MKLAIIGDRGIPAKYSGFSTLAEQMAVRLVGEYDYEVTVYCRSNYFQEQPKTFKGVKCIYLPCPGGKNFESIVHSNLAIVHAAFCTYDVVLVLDPGNGPFILPLKLKRVPVIMHTDGMGWKRAKWGNFQRKYYKWSEKVTAALSNWLVTDSKAMQAYYEDEYQAKSTFIPYAGAVGTGQDLSILDEFKLEVKKYFICVARIEPDNNIRLIIDEFRKAKVGKKLVVVGNAIYDTEYGRAVAAEHDGHVMCIGGVYDKNKLNALLHNSYVYIHGHEVGGTNPSLLTAMHMSASPICMDVVFHREVMSNEGRFFSKEPGSLSALINILEMEPAEVNRLGKLAKSRSDSLYRWDAVVDAYARLAEVIRNHWKNNQALNAQLSSDLYKPLDFTAEVD